MAERFTLLTELGRGGMGVVWKARDEETGQIVALKLLREAYAEDPDYLTRFERELELARRINSEHVVRMLGFGVRGKMPYLAMEYVDGPSLHGALVERGSFTWPETRAMLIQIAKGLGAAHDAGVIHRDVKPSNVLIGPDGVAKLTDFGISRGLDLTRVTATSTILGTPAYLAPEGPKDGRSDLYSLGVIGYELLAGRLPFTGTSHQEVIVEHIRTAPDLNRIPPESRPAIGWLLAKSPAARPQTTQELISVLQGEAKAPEVKATPVPVAPPRPSYQPPVQVAIAPTYTAPMPARRTGPLLAGLGAVALVVVIVGAMIAIGGHGGGAGPSNASSANASDASTAQAQQRPAGIPGTFSSVGNMTQIRDEATATLLPDGRVLIAGGTDNDYYDLQSADIFDPAADKFSATNPMSTPRSGAAPVLLPNGLVLIAGGSGASSDRVATAELFDPKTNKFTATGSMQSARACLTATLLKNGKVLITGDMDTVAELYDPSAGTFSPTGSMSVRRCSSTATLLADGHVLIVGGDTDAAHPSAELYDPGSGTFSLTGAPGVSLSEGTATLLADGRVLIAGGSPKSGNVSAGAEIYEPATGQFVATGLLNVARDLATATLLPNGKVLIAGGFDGKYDLKSVELFDPSSNTFSLTGELAVARGWATATLLRDGRVLIAGGGLAASAEVYQP
jgi:hypothetical protein